jgi:integrase
MGTLGLRTVKRTETYTLYIEYTHQNHFKRINTGVNFKVDQIPYYNKDNPLQPFKRGVTDYKEKNTIVAKKYRFCKEIVDSFNSDISVTVFLNKYKEQINNETKVYTGENVMSFTEDWIKTDKYTRDGKRLLTKNSIKSRKQSINKLKEYFPSLTALDINSKLYVQLKDKANDENKDLNTTGNYIKYARVYFDWVSKNKGIDLPAFISKEWTILKAKAKSPIYLYEEEINILKKDIELTERLQRIRDILLFNIAVPLRIGDLKSFNKSQIKGNFIELQQQGKNKKSLRIPINSETKEILEKHNYTLPIGSDQKYNQGLKDLLKAYQLDREVEEIKQPGMQEKRTYSKLYEVFTAHDAIHTWVTLALSKGVSPKTISSVIGKDVSTIINYYWGQTSEDYQRDIEKMLN